MIMPNMRKDVWKLGQGWSDTLVWYAKAVAVMQARPITDPTSWTYLAAMHGFDPSVWEPFGYITRTTALPPQAAQDRDWKQCQHQSWYFLPWHRGYLGAFEAIVRAAVVSLGGPADWALPYWNYTDRTNPNAGNLPPAFSAAALPDGTPNALLVTRRYGEDSRGTIAMTQQDINIDALTEDQFDDGGSDGTAGFGGPQTTFSHDGDTNGMLENQPHNVVHGLVGGMVRGGNPRRATDQGLMSMPDTAALDPIFWVHHSNIDRLWEVWRGMSGHENPTTADWLDGPADRTFFMPAPDGTSHSYTANDMLNTQAPNLNYVYEDISPPAGAATSVASRLTGLSVSAAAIAAITGKEKPMGKRPVAERMGANDAAVQIVGGAVSTRVRLDRAVTRTMAASFGSDAIAGAVPKEPDRVYLNLENVRGDSDAATFRVYVNLPDGADPAAHPELQAGTVSLFGVGKASRVDGTHAGNGISQVLDITRIIDALHLGNGLDLDHLNVRFVPRTEIRPEDKISVGRVSVYRQGR
jgi:tyrosinase